jgi:hypothetical protein
MHAFDAVFLWLVVATIYTYVYIYIYIHGLNIQCEQKLKSNDCHSKKDGIGVQF